jgi:hypothetical protein
MSFDQVPNSELVRGFPDGNHIRAGITGDHGGGILGPKENLDESLAL